MIMTNLKKDGFQVSMCLRYFDYNLSNTYLILKIQNSTESGENSAYSDYIFILILLKFMLREMKN